MSLISPPPEKFHALCFYNAESGMILQTTEFTGGNPELTKLQAFPLVVCGRNTSDGTREAVMMRLNERVEERRREEAKKRRPWWRFW